MPGANFGPLHTPGAKELASERSESVASCGAAGTVLSPLNAWTPLEPFWQSSVVPGTAAVLSAHRDAISPVGLRFTALDGTDSGTSAHLDLVKSDGVFAGGAGSWAF